MDETPVAVVLLRALTYACAVLADTLLFLFLFTRLARVASPLRRVVQGALLGAVLFELLKVGGAYYVERTTSKGAATYGAFAVVVGLLLFLNLVSRLLLLTAAWVVTGPYDSDRAPSGTSSPELARRTGIPEEFAAEPDDATGLRPGGAPSPLLAAVRGADPEPPRSSAAAPAPAPLPPGAETAVRAASVGIGAAGALAAVVVVHGVRAVLGSLRR